jgi:Tol biopolymer transport system component
VRIHRTLLVAVVAAAVVLPTASSAFGTRRGQERPPELLVVATDGYDCPAAQRTDDVSLCTMATTGVLRQIGRGIAGWEPTWSPDKRQIAFVGDLQRGIWRIRADGTGARLLTLNPTFRVSGGTDEAPAWSPGGRQIAFDRVLKHGDLVTDVAIWLVDAGGRKPAHRLTAGFWPEWSPDGRRIAFLRRTRSGELRMQVIGADGRHRRSLEGADPTAGGPHWSPDGRRIAYVNTPDSGRRQLRVLDLTSGRVRTLLRSQSISNVEWSRDGRWLAYVVATDEEEVDGVCSLCHSDLWLHRVADGHRELIFSGVAEFVGLDW